jgi:hypothetical protein
MTQLNTELRSKIDAFLEELTALVKQSALDSVQAALANRTAPARRGPGRPRMNIKVGRPAKPAMKGGKRTPKEVEAMAAKIAAYVRSNPGKRLEQIASGLGTSTHEMKFPVTKLLASKALSKKGQKRGTTYFAGAKSKER